MKNSEKLTLMDPKFSIIRLKLLSNVCFNYVDPSIAIGYGTNVVVCLNVQSWGEQLNFRHFRPKLTNFSL